MAANLQWISDLAKRSLIAVNWGIFGWRRDALLDRIIDRGVQVLCLTRRNNILWRTLGSHHRSHCIHITMHMRSQTKKYQQRLARAVNPKPTTVWVLCGHTFTSVHVRTRTPTPMQNATCACESRRMGHTHR